MAIWSAEIKDLVKLLESFKGHFPDLEKEFGHLIKAEDENMILLYSRRCLEVIITELCEYELKRPRGTEPLKGIIDKLNKEGKVPKHIIASMNGLNELSTFGTHPKDFDPEQIKPVLVNLGIIIKWYLKYKDTKFNLKEETGKVKNVVNVPDGTIGQNQKPKKRLILLLSGLTLFAAIVVVALFVFKIIGGGSNQELEKSIAVLPFINDSPSDSNQYFINGLKEEILNNLQTIKNFRVLSRTSTEQYKGESKPPIPDIARQLGVNYIVEGSGEKYGNIIRLRVQLIVVNGGRESHVWGESYEQDISKARDYFLIQNRIAESIADELKTIITPEEKQVLNRIPTSDLTAYDLFLKANEFLEEYRKTHDISSYQTAVNLYTAASEIDTTFAQAYVGLAWAYSNRFYWTEYFKEDFLDSCLMLANIALSKDDKLADAYYIKGLYYEQNGKIEEALINFDKTIEINPNFCSAYIEKGNLLSYLLFDNVKGLENFHKALTLVGVDERPSLLQNLGNMYADLGFFEKAKYYYKEAFDISNNQIDYLWYLAWIEFRLENYDEALKIQKKRLAIDTTALFNLHFLLYAPGHIEEAYIHANKLIESYKRSGTPMHYFSHRIGYTFYQVGKFKEADYYLKQQIKYSEESMKLNRPYAQNMDSHYDLSATYAFLGDKAKAYQHLDEYNTMDYYSLNKISFVENDPMYASIRDEERFQKIVQNMKAKNKAEHDRVEKWLEEQGMI